MDLKLIQRLVYDGNYERAIVLLIEFIEKQQKDIDSLKAQRNRET